MALKNKIILVGTTEALNAFREGMSTLTDANYDLNEIGSVLIESYQTTPSDDPRFYFEIRDEFSEHFARSHTARDFETAFGHYNKLFENMFDQLDRQQFDQLASDRFLMAFKDWIGDDLAVLLYPPTCE